MATIWLIPKNAVEAGLMAEQSKGGHKGEFKILLLEDDEALGRGICMALETSSRTVTHCSTRCQATGILQSTAFDLLIFDINLPDGSGLELLRALRQSGRPYACDLAHRQRPGAG